MIIFEGGGGRQPSKTSIRCSFSRVEVDGVGKEQPPSKTQLRFRGQGLRHDEEGFTPPGHVGKV